MTAATYGQLRFFPREGGRPDTWCIQATPDVVLRIKRILPRVRTEAARVLTIVANPTISRDLAWITERWPLTMTDDDRDRLHAGAAAHRAQEQAVQAILQGEHVDAPAARTPAQPSRAYQLVAGDLIATVQRTLIGDALGLGKTHEGLLALRNVDALPALVVVQTHLPPQWLAQVNAIWPGLAVNVPKRRTPTEAELATLPDVTILGYSKLAGWQHHLADRVRTVIFDEAQELRRGASTDKGRAAAAIGAGANYVVGLTNTPVYNYAEEIWHIYEAIAPGRLGTLDEFRRERGGRNWQTPDGLTTGTVADPAALAAWLRSEGLLLSRTREEVGRELPYGEPIRVAHTVGHDSHILDALSGDAVELARLILARDTDKSVRYVAGGELDRRLRQQTGVAKAPYVAAFVRNLLEAGEPRVVIWGWHHAVYDLLQQQLAPYGVVRYTGTETTAVKANAFQHFRSGRARVLMMSLRAGAGLDGLQEVCKIGVFAELDWSPAVATQCLGRLARDGQAAEVVGYFLTAADGADPLMLETLGLKTGQAAPFSSPTAVTPVLLNDGGSRVKELARRVLQRHGITPPTAPDAGVDAQLDQAG